MQFPRNQIIVFDGLDCSFKETNFKEYSKFLRLTFYDESYKIFTESFPRYGNKNCVGVEKWLDGGLDRSHLSKYPYATSSLYAIDRLTYWYESVHGMERHINELDLNGLLKTNSCFIFDRYSTSNAIYSTLNGQFVTEKDLLFEKEYFGIPLPTIVVWMRMRDFEVLDQMIKQKSEKDENEMDTSFIRKVWERSEDAITSGVYEKAGIDLLVIECLNDDGSIKSKRQLANEIKTELAKIIDRRLENEQQSACERKHNFKN